MAADPVGGPGPELADVQGLVARGYGELTAATFLLGRIEGGAAARGWLAGLAELVTPADRRPEGRAVHVAFTSEGLRRPRRLSPSTRVRRRWRTSSDWA